MRAGPPTSMSQSPARAAPAILPSVAWSERDYRALAALAGGAVSVPPALALGMQAVWLLGAADSSSSTAAAMVGLFVAVAIFYGGLFLGALGARVIVAFLQRLRPRREEL